MIGDGFLGYQRRHHKDHHLEFGESMTKDQIDILQLAFLASWDFHRAFQACGAAECMRQDAKERWRELREGKTRL